MNGPLGRRDFLVRTGLVLSAETLARAGAARTRKTPPKSSETLWRSVRRQFNLDPGYIHLGTLLLASHPQPVRSAIDRHRRGLDRHPVHYLYHNRWDFEAAVLSAASEYLGVDASEIALTDSTTMGLGILYGGIRLRADQEAIATVHSHYSTRESIRLRSLRTGARRREIRLFDDPKTASVDEIIASVRTAISPATRVLAVTWVHSSTGFKVPIRAIADFLRDVNRHRGPDDRVLLCVDGVHGFGIEDVTMADLGCDFFVAGCHKWLFGPRGTGIVWGRNDVWKETEPTIPTFSGHSTPSRELTPGGFHSFEHRWALAEAFEFHTHLGKDRIAARTHELARALKEELSKIPGVRLYTPMSDELSAGLVCFEMPNMSSDDAAETLWERKIVASVAPYENRYLRFAPGITNSHRDLDRALRVVRDLVKR